MAIHVYAVEVLIVKREHFSSSDGLQFSSTRIQAHGMTDEFFNEERQAQQFMREWLETHRGEARIATFKVQGDRYPVAQTSKSLAEGAEWMGQLTGYTPDLSSFTENAKYAAIDLSKIPYEQLASELARRNAAMRTEHRGGRPKVLRPCPKCGVKLGTRELSTHNCVA